MSRKNTLRTAVLALALVLPLAPAAAWAAGPAALPGPADFLQSVWSWLTGLWSLDTLDHRGCIDPDGGACATQATQVDARICIDPNGGSCSPQEVQADHGICIDPDGGSCAR
jgi:hypothetical protein